VLLVEDYGVLFSGDTIYKGRVPFLDSPQTDTRHWLEGLEALAAMEPPPRFVIPGHGEPSTSVQEAIAATSGYMRHVREAMQRAVDDFVPFAEAYERTDWSEYEDLPAFDASNRGNAYRIYLELEAESLQR
jgi:glyoxylase-like metal-dependent hydrolase (beta-lactamase superfamily II)